MSYARIFSPSKTSMQSGKAKTGYWVLQFNACDAKYADPVMGWTGSHSTLEQINLKFKTLKTAIDYAQHHGLAVIVDLQQTPRVQRKAYADNFRHDRPLG
ncbi:ETC complex I subunit [Candidatus Paracaedibacter symbiosus]|uniref:ETC complex I subunit n=1 Tax=Candidatus Paracaedibacter symbiosus TaxID=244582 RepID=UPI0005095142|nr:ETC complex I subunit [Candidatus Paracaedibacter symbiosus]